MSTGNKRDLQHPRKKMKTRIHPLYRITVVAWLALAASCLSQATITWQENWESPVAQDNWYADNGYWEIGVPTYGPPTNSLGWRAHQGTNCAGTVLNGNYTDDRES